MRKIMLLALVLVISLFGCSLFGPKTAVSVSVAGLFNNVEARSLSVVEAKSLSSDSNFTWATVDGLRVVLNEIRITDDSDQNHTLVSFGSAGEVLEIGDGYSGRLDVDNDVVQGSYLSYQLELDASYDIKAYGYTADKLIYTTASGVQTAPGTTQIADVTGYDFFHYDFLYVSTADSPTDTSDTAREGWNLETPLVIGDEPVGIQLLIDTSNLAMMWDGTGSRPQNTPFVWDSNNGTSITQFFPDGQAAIAVWYIPMFLSFDDPGTTVGEVYLISQENASDLDPQTADISSLQTMTWVTNSVGEYVGSRIVAMSGSQRFSQFNTGVELQSDGTYVFYNGGFVDGFLQDRIITGFSRLALNAQTTITMDNGPTVETSPQRQALPAPLDFIVARVK